MRVQSQFIEMFGGCANRIKLSSLCSTFVDGDWIESKDQSELGIRLIQTGNVGNGFFKDKEDKSRYISEETFDNLHCTEIYPGDILVSRLPDPIGRACIIPQGLGRTITAVDCTIICLKDIILPDYFIAYTMTPSYAAQINEVTTGTTRRRVSRANLGNILIPCPSIAKQQQFVAIVNQADKSKFVSFKSQFIEMFGNSIHTKKLIEVCNIEKGSTITKEQTSNGDIPVVAGGLEPSCYHNVANRPAGMITVSASGANAGYVNYWEVPIFASDCNTIYPIELEKVSPIFMYWQLKVIQKQIYKLQKGGAQPHVYGKDLADMQIVQPPMEFQLRYIKIAEQADKSKYYN